MIRKKSLLVIYITVLMVLLLSNIFSYSTKNYKQEYGITTTNVNLRKMPNNNSSSIVKTIKSNTKLKIVGKIADFYIVVLETKEVGFMSKDFVKTANNITITTTYYETISPYFADVQNMDTNIRLGPNTTFKVIRQTKYF
ncbi:MAG: hypothetical protein RSE00_03025 [Clostridia bacterium]